jgi:hypothetical protein
LPVWLLFARSTAFDRLEDLLIRSSPAEVALAPNGLTRRAIKVSPRISDRIRGKRERDDTTMSFKGFPLPFTCPAECRGELSVSPNLRQGEEVSLEVITYGNPRPGQNRNLKKSVNRRSGAASSARPSRRVGDRLFGHASRTILGVVLTDDRPLGEAVSYYVSIHLVALD